LCKAGDLAEKPLSFAVRLVQKAVAMMTDGYMRSAIDYFEVNRLKPSLTTTFLTWSRLSFQTGDFGWGEAVYSAPVTLPGRQVVLLLSHGKEMEGINVLLGLPSRALKQYKEYIQSCLIPGDVEIRLRKST